MRIHGITLNDIYCRTYDGGDCMTLHADEAKELAKGDPGLYLRDSKGGVVLSQFDGKPLLRHGPNDRDDTHRGLQYEPED